MHTPRSRHALGIGALLALLVTALVMAGGPAATASTGDTESSGAAECALPEPNDEDNKISVLGRICDRRESPAVGVQGVEVTVKDEGGATVGEATSGADGTFVVDLPGDPSTLLGKSFTVSLDKETLP